MDVLIITGGAGFLAMLVAAAILERIGGNRIARLLRLPPGDYR